MHSEASNDVIDESAILLEKLLHVSLKSEEGISFLRSFLTKSECTKSMEMRDEVLFP